MDYTPSFQFHKGTIRTLKKAERENETYSHFNSIKVRLEPATARANVRKLNSDFNSIKVRLEQEHGPQSISEWTISIP